MKHPLQKGTKKTDPLMQTSSEELEDVSDVYQEYPEYEDYQEEQVVDYTPAEGHPLNVNAGYPEETHMWINGLVDNSTNLMCVVNNGYISFINKTGVGMLRFLDAQEIVGMPFIDILDETVKESFINDFEYIINRQSPYQTVLITTDNQKIDVDISVISLSPEVDTSFLIEAKDISYLKQIEEKFKMNEQRIKQNSMHDDLTGLPSSNLFEDRLQMAIARSTRRAYGKADASQNRIAVVIMTVDKMEAITKEFGQEAADHVLRNIAIRLASSFRNCDTIAKDDNKSFLLILEGINTFDDAETVARRTLGIMYEQIGYKGNNLALGCSIGISIFPEHGIKARKLLNAAEQALEEVVKRGGNFYMVYNEDLAIM
ncbi:MAG: diguanylate cyclase [Alphaproteobacteria bacterium]